jgi:transposase-like protein
VAKQQYSDDDKANALAALQANGGNTSLTARQLGIPRATLINWSNGNGVHPVVSEIGQVKKEALADRLEDVAHRLVDAMPDKIKDANLQQVTVSMGIAVEKMRLLREQPTSINGGEIPDEQRLEFLRAVIDRIAPKRPAPAANGRAAGGALDS